MTHPLGRLLAIAIRAVFVSSLLATSIGFAQETPSDDVARKWYQLARRRRLARRWN